MWWLAFTACLVNTDLYEERLAALADEDGDGVTVEDGDCDDEDAMIAPGQPELCDGIDQDCDGVVDEDPTDPTNWYQDSDSDEFGAGEPVPACDAPSGWVATNGDCDDGDADVHPGAEEVPYDGIDQDCDQEDLTDVDGDGFDAVEAGGEDCDDDDPDTWPGAPDSWYDGVDSDCGGEDDDDADADGYASSEHGGTDCDDQDASIHPDAEETWANGATDNDCDGDYGAATLEYGADAWTGEASGDNAGRRVSALGDISGDGLAEFAVSAIYQGSAYSYGGAVYIVSGGEPGPLGEEGVVRPGGENWMLGYELGSGDVDDDGMPDLLMSAILYDDGIGSAWLVSGDKLPGPGEEVDVDDVATWQVTGDVHEGYLGDGLAVVGDLDGDGLPDVGVGAPNVDSGGHVATGELGVFLDRDGSPALADADLRAWPEYDYARLGERIMAAGDQDGDGYDDFMASYADGRIAQILPGGVGELDLENPISEVVEDGEVDNVAPWMIGDVDGDGRRDLAVIVDSHAVLLYTLLAANPTRTNSSATSSVEIDGDSYIFTVLDAGDLDGDGTDESVITANWYEPAQTAAGIILFGPDFENADGFMFGDAPLMFESQRLYAYFGYRAAVSDDIDGDGRREIILGGPGDPDPEELVGAAATVPLPQ